MTIETAACKSTGKETADVQPDPAKAHGGAPAGNTNRALHGLYGFGLPSGAQRLGRRINAFRRSLCEAVEVRAGEIDLHAAATIDSACQWLRHGLLAARWLRLQHDELSPDQKLAFSREVARAATERDKCIRLLRLDKAIGECFDPAATYLRSLPPYKPPDAATRDVDALAETEAAPPASDASNAAVGDPPDDDNPMPLIPVF